MVLMTGIQTIWIHHKAWTRCRPCVYTYLLSSSALWHLSGLLWREWLCMDKWDFWILNQSTLLWQSVYFSVLFQKHKENQEGFLWKPKFHLHLNSELIGMSKYFSKFTLFELKLMSLNYLKKLQRNWRDGLEFKNTVLFSSGPGFSFQNPHSGGQSFFCSPPASDMYKLHRYANTKPLKNIK